MLEKKRVGAFFFATTEFSEAQRAGWEAEANWAKEEYAKEAAHVAELQRALAEEQACRRAAEKQQEEQLRLLKDCVTCTSCEQYRS